MRAHGMFCRLQRAACQPQGLLVSPPRHSAAAPRRGRERRLQPRARTHLDVRALARLLRRDVCLLRVLRTRATRASAAARAARDARATRAQRADALRACGSTSTRFSIASGSSMGKKRQRRGRAAGLASGHRAAELLKIGVLTRAARLAGASAPWLVRTPRAAGRSARSCAREQTRGVPTRRVRRGTALRDTIPEPGCGARMGARAHH